jgi:hypothetical protein
MTDILTHTHARTRTEPSAQGRLVFLRIFDYVDSPLVAYYSTSLPYTSAVISHSARPRGMRGEQLARAPTPVTWWVRMLLQNTRGSWAALYGVVSPTCEKLEPYISMEQPQLSEPVCGACECNLTAGPDPTHTGGRSHTASSLSGFNSAATRKAPRCSSAFGL